MARFVEEAGRAASVYLQPREPSGAPKRSLVTDEIVQVVKTLAQVQEAWLRRPDKALEAQRALWRSYLDLWAASMRRLMGDGAEPVAAPDPKDARFYVRQILNALAPSNLLLTNPELLRETFASDGENLARGMRLLAEDIERGHGTLKLRQSDPDKFEVGRNLAVTPGKVIFQNELIQLIQYEASTKQVLKRPLLIVPPWINKFYILDLTPEKSFIKWAVDQGQTVFIISWVNPDERLAHKSFEDYMREGVLAAVNALHEDTGERAINALGYC